MPTAVLFFNSQVLAVGLVLTHLLNTDEVQKGTLAPSSLGGVLGLYLPPSVAMYKNVSSEFLGLSAHIPLWHVGN